MFRDRIFHEERFFRSSRRGTCFHKGDLKYVILDLLKDKPSGVIYPTLQMLEEMGYASSNEQEGKKVYSITEEGLKFLTNQSNVADGVRKQMKHKWSFKNIGKMIMVMREYHALENLLGSSFRSLDADKAEQIRQILSEAYQAIESVLQE